MCRNDKGHLLVGLIPESKQADLLPGIPGPKLPNIFLQLFEQFWVIRLFSKANIVDNLCYQLPVKMGSKLFSLLQNIVSK